MKLFLNEIKRGIKTPGKPFNFHRPTYLTIPFCRLSEIRLICKNADYFYFSIIKARAMKGVIQCEP
ncbi:hypothetical protein EMIT0P12_30279 [Pseudomonas sp. IT-P12]